MVSTAEQRREEAGLVPGFLRRAAPGLKVAGEPGH